MPTFTRTCSRCNGRKVFNQYRHVSEGICFLCEGTGIEIVDTDAIQAEKDRVKKVKETHKEIKEAVEKENAKWETTESKTFPGLILKTLKSDPNHIEFIGGLAKIAEYKAGELTFIYEPEEEVENHIKGYIQKKFGK